MNVHISYKISRTPDLEKLINQQAEKLGKYLQVFRPELVHLKGIIEENSARQGFAVLLNLRLPSGQMTSQGNGPTATVSIKTAFESVTEQLKKHKEVLRKRHKWVRKRGLARAQTERVPFEETFAAVRPEQISASDISSYINVSLPRLSRFIQRELDHRESLGELLSGQLQVEDVVGEAIATALSDDHDKPEPMKVEPWLYRLAKQAIDRLAWEGRDEGHVPLERSRGQQNVLATDEAILQFHQPNDRLYEENVIPDPAANNPEELAAQHELISLVETALRDAGHNEREAFMLYTTEGFTLEEIAHISCRSVEEVRASIRKAREHLQRALPIQDPLKEKLVEYSRSA